MREPAAQSLLDVICLTTSSTYIPTDTDVDFMVLKPISILSPVGGESYAAGATMNIRWVTIQSRVPEVLIQLSINGGEDFTAISGAGSISTTSPNWGNYSYVIPANQVSNQCYVRVVNYNEQSVFETSPSAFTITQSSIVSHRAAVNLCVANSVQAYRDRNGRLELRLSREGVYGIQVLDLRGTILARGSERGPRSIVMSELIAPGVLVVKVNGPGGDAPVVLRVAR